MRTNIEIDDKLMSDAMKLSGMKTKRATIEAALELMLKIERQKKFRELRGIGWEGDLDAMRRDKPHDPL